MAGFVARIHGDEGLADQMAREYAGLSDKKIPLLSGKPDLEHMENIGANYLQIKAVVSAILHNLSGTQAQKKQKVKAYIQEAGGISQAIAQYNNVFNRVLGSVKKNNSFTDVFDYAKKLPKGGDIAASVLCGDKVNVNSSLVTCMEVAAVEALQNLYYNITSYNDSSIGKFLHNVAESGIVPKAAQASMGCILRAAVNSTSPRNFTASLLAYTSKAAEVCNAHVDPVNPGGNGGNGLKVSEEIFYPVIALFSVVGLSIVAKIKYDKCMQERRERAPRDVYIRVGREK